MRLVELVAGILFQ